MAFCEEVVGLEGRSQFGVTVDDEPQIFLVFEFWHVDFLQS